MLHVMKNETEKHMMHKEFSMDDTKLFRQKTAKIYSLFTRGSRAGSKTCAEIESCVQGRCVFAACFFIAADSFSVLLICSRFVLLFPPLLCLPVSVPMQYLWPAALRYIFHIYNNTTQGAF
jgi:hypothetical protein